MEKIQKQLIDFCIQENLQVTVKPLCVVSRLSGKRSQFDFDSGDAEPIVTLSLFNLPENIALQKVIREN